jgi:predicted ATP-dependent endonuclease of OLD family
MGHGLQRSYLLALLQELAGSEAVDAPTLILGCEEPELYQHPPQARHLADVFIELATGNNQILVTTHSPLFVSGDGFENTRLVRRPNNNAGSQVKALTFQNLESTDFAATFSATFSGPPRAAPAQGVVARA